MATPPLATANVQVPVISLSVTEEELVNGIRGKCEDKFRLLYKMYAPALMGVISRIVRSDVAAEDVLQDTFVKIWNSIESYDSSRGRLFTWMAATARNTAIDQLRSRAQINTAKHSNIDPDTMHTSEKEVLDLIYFQGYTHSEASKTLNIPLGTVKTKLRRAINALREYF